MENKIWVTRDQGRIWAHAADLTRAAIEETGLAEAASDAIDDAQEHLGLMVEEIMHDREIALQEEAVGLAVEEYGSPAEVAEAYLQMNEEVKAKEKKRQVKRENRSFLCDIFCIYGDWRTYISLLYLFLMFPIGIIYFTNPIAYIIPSLPF